MTSTPESSQTHQPGRVWNISDGMFLPEATVFKEQLDEKDVTRFIKDPEAKTRVLAVEALTYAIELTSPDLAQESAVVSSAVIEIAAEALKTRDLSPNELDGLIVEAVSRGMERGPTTDAIGRFIEQKLIDFETARRAIAILAKIYLKDADS